jgi:hypothetical protein
MVDCWLRSVDAGLDFIKITIHPPSSSDSRTLPLVQSKRNIISLPIGPYGVRPKDTVSPKKSFGRVRTVGSYK